MRKEKLTVLTRESEQLSLENFIVMPPIAKTKEQGLNILHINTQNSPYTLNPSASAFVKEYLLKDDIKAFKNDSSILKFAVERALKHEGVFLEFGFCTGTTLNFIAALAYDREIFGFDSLRGLPVNWRSGFPEKVFAYKDKNRFPFVPLPNVSLVIGLIEDTLPTFNTNILTTAPVAFIHIDSDTVEAATTIYNGLKNKIEPGKTIIVLDEGYNFTDKENARDDEWKKHEFSATQQFARQMGYTIQYLAFNENHQQLVLIFNE